MACTQASATSSEPAYRPAEPASTASDDGARVAPPTRPPASVARVGGADAEVDDWVDGAVAAAGVGSRSLVSRKTSSRPSPDRSTAVPTISQGSRLFLGGGAPYPAGPGGGP